MDVDCLVVKSEVRPALSGGYYLALIITDGEKRLTARLFNFPNDYKPESGEVVCIKGVVNEWNRSLPITINSMEPRKITTPGELES